jgi:putative heme-binding domain-containing protein
LFVHEDVGLAATALRLAGAWKLESLRAELMRRAEDSKIDAPRRQAAVDALVDLGGPATLEALTSLSGGKHAPPVRAQAILGMATLDVDRAARLAAQFLHEPSATAAPLDPLFAAFVQRKGGSAALAQALDKEKPAPDAARIGLRVLVELGAAAPELTAKLRAALGPLGARRTPTGPQSRRILGMVQAQGDAARGEALFRRPALGCAQCHALGGAGGRVGPDLSAIGASAPVEYLLDSILSPAKVVREGYTTAHVVTTSGKSLTGILQRESSKELVLRDPIHDDLTIAAGDIEEKRIGGSLMPDGLDQTLTDTEVADLVRFLSELGKPGPFLVTHVQRARRWQALSKAPAASDDAELGKALSHDARLPWTTLYSRVSGDVPLDDPPVAALRTQVETLVPGRVTLALDDPRGLRLWMDGQPVPAAKHITLDLARGMHTLAVLVEGRQRGVSTLRCELADTPGSAAQARFVLGK